MITQGRIFYAEAKESADTSAHGVSDSEIVIGCTFIGGIGSEALKASRNVTQASVRDSVFYGGVEDCVDVLGSTNVTFSKCNFIRGRAKRDCTIKGSAKNIHFINCLGLRYIKAGDCTIYEKYGLLPPVSGCHVKNADGKKTLVLCLNSEPFTGDVFNVIVPKPLVRIYFWLRWKLFPNK